MKTSVFYGKENIKVEDRPVPEVGADEVKIKVAWTGICGSDLHEYVDGPTHFFAADKEMPGLGKMAPLNTGHEFSGVVEEIGSDVKNVKVGDRVTVNAMLNPIAQKAIGAASPASHAEYSVVQENTIYKLPEDMDLEEAAVVEPAATALQAVKDSGLVIGDTAVVIGVGPIGLLTIIAARAAGASKIIGVDLSETRLKKAKDVGATHIINSGEVDAVEAIKGILPEGADVTFEVAGIEATFRQAVSVTKRGGKVNIVSVFTKEFSWSPTDLQMNAVSLTSTLAYTPETFGQTIDLIATGQMKVKEVVTSHIELDNIVKEGFEALIHDKSQAKILVKMSGEQ